MNIKSEQLHYGNIKLHLHDLDLSGDEQNAQINPESQGNEPGSANLQINGHFDRAGTVERHPSKI